MYPKKEEISAWKLSVTLNLEEIIHKMWWGNYSRTLLWKIKIEHISGSTVWNVIQFVFLACPSWGLPKHNKTKVLTTCFDLMSSLFLKKQIRGLELVSLPHCQRDFWIKIFLNGIKVRVFFGKNIKKKHLCPHDKNYRCFCKSDIPVINLILGSENMIKPSKNMSLYKIR